MAGIGLRNKGQLDVTGAWKAFAVQRQAGYGRGQDIYQYRPSKQARPSQGPTHASHSVGNGNFFNRGKRPERYANAQLVSRLRIIGVILSLPHTPS
jgi:hypothetical protein